jgi:F0F1-type ATP synthase alpha subunit
MRRGEAIVAAMQQQQYNPVSVDELALVLHALRSGRLDGLAPRQRSTFLDTIRGFALERDPGLLEQIMTAEHLTPELDAAMQRLMEAYFSAAAPDAAPAAPEPEA